MSIVAEIRKPFRVEQLEPDTPEKFIRVIEGELIVSLPPPRSHNKVVMEFRVLFHRFCEARTGIESGGPNDYFLLKRDPDVFFSPDVCLFRVRPEPEVPWMEGAPEIPVEVLCPANTPVEMVYRRHRYFEAGAQQVWIVDQRKRTIEFYFHDGRRVVAEGTEVVMGEGIADGMEIELARIFSSQPAS